ncbi:Nucleotidyltransferase [Friedmanniella luteola]|uniref:Nucleotidyltransferase n=1 Tax=Friedmanniella luteola TaxID=546871 RepID=A0A1H1ZUP3_9ACTN|nr:DUF427 domain-containing protein [Friedmanniella luteola]SDT37438.1 Nucleotidyltransferase [Friedmanniella luteola]
MKAIWNDTVIAQSEDTVVVEGNHYFPLESVTPGVLEPTTTHTVCPWKGTASYYSVQVGGETNVDAAWTYPEPKPAAAEITDRLAFWKGVRVVD